MFPWFRQRRSTNWRNSITQRLCAIGKPQGEKSATGQLTSAKGKFEGAAAQLSYTEIRSPIDGVVTDRPLYPGETPTAGTALLTIMDTSSVIAKAHFRRMKRPF